MTESPMISNSNLRRSLLLFFLLCVTPAFAQNCLTADDIDAGARANLQNTGLQFFRLSAAGDVAGLKAAAIPSLANSFAGVETAVNDHKTDFAGAQATPASIYVLEAPGTSTNARAEFFCGVFNSQDRVSFVIPDLAPGRYAVVTEDVVGGHRPLKLTFVLQQQGNHWALAGYTLKTTEIGGHNLNWYLTQARQYKSRGQNMAAYLSYLEAWDLSQPVEIEYTVQQDKLADEMQQARPADWPANNQPMTLMAAAKSYRITQLFPAIVGDDLDLIVKYQATTDVSNTAVAFQDNMAVIKGIVAKYPELRAAFAGVVARAVDPSGRDYGSLLAMKDVK
jgi:hypothetical protein